MKKTLFIITIMFLIGSRLLANDYYWVGGSGNWSDYANHWATSSGGTTFHAQPPTELDNVYFDNNSFSEPGAVVSLDESAMCANMNWTGALNNPQFDGSWNMSLNIHGSLTFIAEMDFNVSGNVYFQSTSSGNTITSAGQGFNRNVYFQGTGEWILQDNFLQTGNNVVYFERGILDFNNHDVTLTQFDTYFENVRTLILGDGTFTITSGHSSAFRFRGENLTFNAGNSTVIFTGSGPGLNHVNNRGNGLTFNDVIFENPEGTSTLSNENGYFNSLTFHGNAAISGPNIIQTLTFQANGTINTNDNDISNLIGDGNITINDSGNYGHILLNGNATFDGNNIINTLELTPGNTYTFANGENQIITDNLIANGTCALQIIIQSSSTGSQSSISKSGGTVEIEYCILSDINASGGASFVANNTVDMGNNSGWTINEPAPLDLYWVGGSGYWDDPANWAFISGGEGGACVPTPIDNVFFDANSFDAPGQTVTMTGDGNDQVKFKNMNWVGVTNNPVLTGSPQTTINIYGSLTLSPGMTYDYEGGVHFRAVSGGNTIFTAGNLLDKNHIYFNGEGGEWILQDGLNIGTQTLYLVRGTLNTNNQMVQAGILNSNYSSNERSLILGSSEVILTSTSNSTIRIHGDNMTLDAGTSLIHMTGSGTGIYNLYGGGLFFHDVVFEATTGTVNVYNLNGGFNTLVYNSTGTNRLYRSNVVDSIYFAGNAGIYHDNNNINKVVFNGDVTISGNNSIYGDLDIPGDASLSGNSTYGDVNIAGEASIGDGGSYAGLVLSGNTSITGNNTIGILELTAGNQYTLRNDRTQTILEDFIANGTESELIIIRSSSPGNQSTFTKEEGTVTLNYVSLQDNNATGGAAFIADNSYDMGNNTGWTINVPPGRDLYWVGATGSWDDMSNWSLSSGGEGGAGTPSFVDNVYFDGNSFTEPGQTVTLVGDASDNIFCMNMDWTGAGHQPVFAGTSAYDLRIYGSLTLIEDMSYDFEGSVYFQSEEVGNTIFTAGNPLDKNHIYFNGEGGEWILQDGLNIGTQTLYLVRGTLNTNNQMVQAGILNSNYSSNERSLILGSSEVILTSTSNSTIRIHGDNMTLDAGTSLIHMTGSGTGIYNLYGGGLFFHDVVFEAATGTVNVYNLNGGFNTLVYNSTGTNRLYRSNVVDSIYFAGNAGIYHDNNNINKVVFNGDVTISGNNSIYGDLDIPGDASLSGNSTYGDVNIAGEASIGDGGSYDRLLLSADASITSNNTIGVLEFTAGNQYTLRNDRTQTILEDFIANGTESEVIIIRSSSVGSQTSFSKEEGTVTLNYVSLQDINATGGAEFVADNSYDMGNNTGWTVNVPPSRDLYWVGGTGSWNDMANWSLSSGGEGGAGTPSFVDNVYFDGNSFTEPGQTVTLVGDASDNIFCMNMDWTGAGHQPVFAGTSAYDLRIYGSLTLIEDMSYDFEGSVYFQSEEVGNTIFTAGNPLDKNHIYFNGEGGEWILQDGLNIGTQTLYLVRGNLNTNNQMVQAGILNSNYSSNERALILGSSEVILTSTSNSTIRIHGDNMTLDAGTSLIHMTGSGTGIYNLYGGGLFFHDVVFEATTGTVNVYNLNGGFNTLVYNSTGTNRLYRGNVVDSVYFAGNGGIYHDGNDVNIALFESEATISGDGNYGHILMHGDGSITGNNTISTLELTPGNTYTLTSGRTQNISDDLIANGTCYSPIIIQSSSTTQTTLNKDEGIVNISYTNLKGINATGNAEFLAESCIDLGNNSGWTFSHVVHNLYWVGNTGDWDDLENWAAESGGDGGYCVPTQLDNVIFDQNSFTQSGQAIYINVENANCNHMDWSMAELSPTFTSNSSNNNLRIHGSLALNAGMNFAFPGRVYFEGGTGEEVQQFSINTAGNNFNNHVYFTGENGYWTLEDHFSTGSNDLYLNYGTLVTNDLNLSCNRFISNNNNLRALELGESMVYVSSSHSSSAWYVDGENITLEPGDSEIRLTAGNAGFRSTGSAELTYNKVVFNNPGGTSTLNSNHNFNSVVFNPAGNIEGSGSYNIVKFFANGEIEGDNNFEDVTFFNNAIIKGTNSFGILEFTAGRNVQMESSKIQTILNEIYFMGNEANPIALQALTDGEQAAITKESGIVTGNFLHLKDMNATGGATFNLYNTTDLGNNTGWNYLEPDEATCPETMQACETSPPFDLDMAMPSGGIYSGEGVFYDEDNEIYMFVPYEIENEYAIITYDVVNGVLSTCDFIIEILQLPEVQCPEDIKVCAENGYITLYEGKGEFTLDGEMITGFDPVTPGIYEITYTETNVCGSSSCIFEIEVMPLPDLECTEDLYFYEEQPLVDLSEYVSPPGEAFTGEYLIVDGDNYYFDPANGLGEYYFEYCVMLDECEDCCHITVHVVDSLNISLTADPEIVCPGDQSQITASVSEGSGNYFYTWTSDPEGFNSNEKDPVVSPETNTTYNLVVFDGFNEAVASIDIEVWDIEPPSEVVNLIPADGSYITQPITFLWDAAHNTTSYNLYIWRSNQQKPKNPTVLNITDTTYTYSDYLNTNYMYNWQVTSINESPCYEIQSVVHSFAFNPLSDLIVSEVVVPDTAIAGSDIHISYTITNIGDGKTGLWQWKDNVYLSQQEEFNASDAILIGTYDNISFLDPDESYTNEIDVTLSNDLEGDYYVYVVTDADNVVPEINEENNILRSQEPTDISLPPYPDLAVVGVTSLSGNIIPGEILTVGWEVENIGDDEAIGGWSQRVAVVSGSQTQVLGYTQNRDVLEASGTIGVSANFMVHEYPEMEGDVFLEVRLTPNPELIEKPNATANNTALSVETVFMERRLAISLPEKSIDEDATSPLRAMIYRSGSRAGELVVTLDVSEENRITLPETVTIPANSAGARFDIYAIDNDLIEGDIDVQITATAGDYLETVTTLTVIDDELPELGMSLSSNEAWEGDTVQLTVTRDFVTDDTLNVTLFTARPNQISLPANVLIPAGEASGVIDIKVIDDDIPELTEDVFIQGTAPGYDPVSVMITIYDDDIPELSFTINPSIVTEDAGPYASWAKVQIDEPVNIDFKIEITANMAGQVFFPNTVSIPAGKTEQEFNIGVIDNDIVDGDRVVEITAAVYIASCGCGAPLGTEGAVSSELTIIDDDGPALSVSANPFVVPENIDNAGELTISRNTPGVEEITVSIQHERNDVLEVQETVIMPEGVKSVDVPFNTLDDEIEGIDHIVSVLVSSEDYSSGSCWIRIMDRNMPDFVATGLTLSEDYLFVNDELDISLQIGNKGFAIAPSGVEVEIYLSQDDKFNRSDRLIAKRYTSSVINIGDSLTINASYIPKDIIGDYYIIARVNGNNEFNELTSINNTTVAEPVSILPDYSATAMVDGDVFNGTMPVTITGYTEAVGKGVLPNKDVDVYVVVSDVRRVFNTTSDENGEFSVDFVPVKGEAGHYIVGACYPGAGSVEAQDDFVILGAKPTEKGYIKWDMRLDETKQFSLEIKNNSSMSLSNVRLEVLSAPPGCEISSSPITSLSGNSYASLNYTVTASEITAGNIYEEVKLQLTSAEGTRFRFSAWFYSEPTKGNLRLDPVVLTRTMIQDQINYAEFEVRNNGMDKTGLITVYLPDVDWMSFAGSDTIPSLQPGATAKVTLRLTPGSDLQLNNPISGELSLSATNAGGITLPFTFEPVSQSTGNLLVDVVNEYTYNTAAAPHLEGANVVVSHPYTGQIIAEGLTNAAGHFVVDDINEGYYNLRVGAKQHSTYQNIIYVEKGKVNTELVFIDFQAISYSWNVVPTMIPDQYEINLVVDFETNVPAPVVVMEMPDTMPHLEHGEVFPFILTLTNHGLITAEDVNITFPEDPEYMFTANVNQMDILPHTSVQVPVIMERRPESKSNSKGELHCSDVVITDFKFECGPDGRLRVVEAGIIYEGRICYFVSTGGSREALRGGINLGPASNLGPGLAPGSGSGMINFPPRVESRTMRSDNVGCDPFLPDILNIFKGAAPMPDPMDPIISASGFKPLAAGRRIWRQARRAFDIGWAIGEKINRDMGWAKSGSSRLDALKELRDDYFMLHKGFAAIEDIIREVYDNEELINKQDFFLFNEFVFPSIDELADISSNRQNEILSDLSSSDLTQTEMTGFFNRWNTTMEAWDLEIFSPTQEYTNIIDKIKIDEYSLSLDTAINYAQEKGYPSLDSLFNSAYRRTENLVDNTSSSVCATVTIQFSQTLTMTREAFEGTLAIFNGHEGLPMENIKFDIEVRDDNGVLRNNLFEITTKSLDQLTGIDGSGVLDPQTEGSAVVMFIPERGAAPDVPRYYTFGGKFSYIDPFTGEFFEQTLYPVTLQVNPSPDLYIDYFMQRDILGNDPLTDVIEPSIPAELAVMIENRGAGPAYGVNIESAQPKIIDNEKGLLIDFEIAGSNLSGQPTQLGLMNVDFGNIESGKTAVGQWWFTSTLLGHFVSYSVSVNHLNSFGNPDLSLISSVNIHELVKSVYVYGDHEDGINDFLVNNIPDSDDIPDALHYSNGIVEQVHLADTSSTDGKVSMSNLAIELSVEPSKTGWNYTRIDDPGKGDFRIVSCIREDGQEIPLDNIWLTHVTIPDGGEPIYENKLHFVDIFTSPPPYSYTVIFEPIEQDIPEVVAINGVPESVIDTHILDVEVVFNKAIDPETFTYEDMILRNQAGPNLMDSTVTVTQINDSIFNVNFANKTAASGHYSLTVETISIYDLIGNHGQVGKQVTWVQAYDAPFIEKFFGIPENPGDPIDSVFVLFNMPIIQSTFTNSQLSLNIVEGNTLSTESLVIEQDESNENLYKISGLMELTSEDDQYILTVNVTEISGFNGEYGLIDQSAQWTVRIIIFYNITANTNNDNYGSVTGGGEYEKSELVSLSAVPATGYHFVNWTENSIEVSTDEVYEFTVEEDRSLVANFAINIYNITALSNDEDFGYVEGSGSYEHFEDGILTAFPKTGYHFVNWTENGIEVSTDEVYEFTAEEDLNLVANFAVNIYNITAASNDEDFGYVEGSGSYEHFNDVILTASPETGYHFVNWTEDGVEVSTDEVYEFTAEEARSLVGNFAINVYSITAIPNDESYGTVTGADDYNHFQMVELIAIPATGYQFVNWTEDEIEVSTEEVFEFMVEKERNLMANFAIKTYVIIGSAGDNGIIEPGGHIIVEYGGKQQFAIKPDAGYHIEDVLVDKISAGAVEEYEFENVTSDHKIHAVFGITTYILSFQVLNAETGGEVNDAIITFDGDDYDDGVYLFEDIAPGMYSYKVSHEGYFEATGDVEIIDEDVDVIVELEVDDTYIDPIEEHIVNVFPNPVSNILYIESNKFISEVHLISMLGHRVIIADVNDMSHELNVFGLKEGMYFLHILTDSGIKTMMIQISN